MVDSKKQKYNIQQTVTHSQNLLIRIFKVRLRQGKVTFDQTIQAKSFRFIVKSGSGDGQGFASCAEMEFFAKNPVNFDYSTLFTDASCSELKTGITEDDIAQCEYPFFKNIAYYMIKVSRRVPYQRVQGIPQSGYPVGNPQDQPLQPVGQSDRNIGQGR